jgi:hypothetical protein
MVPLKHLVEQYAVEEAPKREAEQIARPSEPLREGRWRTAVKRGIGHGGSLARSIATPGA